MEKVSVNNKDILLVDNDSSLATMLKMLLETRGFSVHIVDSVQEALRKVEVTTDLVLSEVSLPDQDGFRLCHKLRHNSKTSHIPIILWGNKLNPNDVIEGLYLGADDCLIKPFPHEELIARMDAIIRRTSPLYRHRTHDRTSEMVVHELRRIINEEAVQPFFQPIFNLRSRQLVGFEALSRPQTGGILSSPEIIFKAAMQYGFYQDLELLSWQKATEYASTYLDHHKLFLNCNPYLIEGKKSIDIKSIFDRRFINTENVVLEITERSAIVDYSFFYDRLESYREHGFQFAIDDMGGGYASLEAIIQIKPEIVKIDRHIVCHLENDLFKKSIVKFIVGFCQENNIFCIAEGIETKEELEMLEQLGVNAGQGYYLYKPNPVIDLKAIATMVPPKL